MMFHFSVSPTAFLHLDYFSLSIMLCLNDVVCVFLHGFYPFILFCPYSPRHLPMVIQGMESSLGDIHFIRKLHAKCEQESGLVLKRYMKFRHIKNTIAMMKTTGTGTGISAIGISGIGGTTPKSTILPSEIHTILDELALLIQYCCLYSKYIKQLTDGAENRVRSNNSLTNSVYSNTNNVESATNNVIVTKPIVISVFGGPTDFDKMVDELINR